jgi:hypothetical protein
MTQMSTPTERASRQVRSARVNRRPPSFVAILIAFAIIFALAWMFFVRSGSSVPTPEVSAVQGTYSWQPAPGATEQKGSFSAVAAGNAGGSAQDPQAETSLGLVAPRSAYEAATRTQTTYSGKGIGRLERVVGEWPPVWRVATRSPLDYQGLSAIVRAAVEDGDHAVGIKPLKQGDRTVWRAAMRMDGKVIDVVVDQKTGIVTWESNGTETFTANVDWASPPPAGATYSVDAPAGTPAKTMTDDTVTYAASPATAGKAAGYDPLVSDLAPDGFKIKAVATWKTDYTPVQWLSDKVIGLPIAGPREPLVAQLSTRGLSWFTTEQIGPKAMKTLGPQLGDLLADVKATQLSFQETTLQYGALKGRTASTWYQPSGPSLFVMGARRAVFVTGALTRQELIAYAEGLKPVPTAARP